VLGLLLADALVEDLGIIVGCILGSFRTAALECDPVTLVLETLRGDETLNLGRLGVWLRALLLGLDFTTDNELADIILLAEIKEAADLGGPLWTKTLWMDTVSKAGELAVTLLDDAESNDSEVHADDAAANGFSLALASSAWSVAGVAIGEQKSDTSRM